MNTTSTPLPQHPLPVVELRITEIRRREREGEDLIVREHRFDAPLDYAAPAAGSIEVFARELSTDRAEAEDYPYLVYLQGGPGSGADRPTVPGGWLKRAMEEYRVVLLDQRGTGLSTPLTAQTMPAGSVAERSDYCTHFRADNIVRDAETLRRALPASRGGERPWTSLGQSYGGFCTLTYLSLHPEGLEASLITGGLAAITWPAERVYRETYAATRRRNSLFFETYPEDAERLREVVRHVAEVAEELPTGERLTPERVLTVGIILGSSTGFHELHYLLEGAFVETADGRRLAAAFLEGLGRIVSLASHPLYGLMHESIYANGPGAATNWAAARVRAELPDFAADASEPLLTGEMIYPWQFAQDPALVALAEVAEHLATREDWGPLYNVAALAANKVPVAGVVYTDDMFVPRSGSVETAGLVRGAQVIETDRYQHNGLREDGALLLGQMLAAVRPDSAGDAGAKG